MYHAAAMRFSAADRQYRNVEIDARVEGASPHQLVAILYEELARALIVTKGGIRQNDFTRRGSGQARALSILAALETSLDFARGGEVAQTLAKVYREIRRLLGIGIARHAVEPVDEARGLVGEIAGAWAAIG